MIISFLTLALTGLSLKFSYTGWAVVLSHFFGGFDDAFAAEDSREQSRAAVLAGDVAGFSAEKLIETVLGDGFGGVPFCSGEINGVVGYAGESGFGAAGA